MKISSSVKFKSYQQVLVSEVLDGGGHAMLFILADTERREPPCNVTSLTKPQEGVAAYPKHFGCRYYYLIGSG